MPPVDSGRNPDLPEPDASVAQNNAENILVWDFPVRVFHWLLVLTFFVALSTGDSDRWRDVHVFSGYLLLGLLMFRMVWGIIGSRYARFRSFLYRPTQAIRYVSDLLGGAGQRYIGHNPAGSWAIYALLGLGLLVSLSGWVVLGAEESHGALKGLFDSALGESIKAIHELSAWAMLSLVAIHVIGVIVEGLIHHENLVKAMITGRKEGVRSEAAPTSHPIAGVLLLAVAVGSGVFFFRDKLFDSKDRPYIPFVGKALPDNSKWRAECSSCHVAYHPTLLPARSWKKLLNEQNQHFGEALGLDAASVAEILAFLEKNSAETGMTEPAFKINRSIPATMAPLRVTETQYWLEKHKSIPDAIWRHAKVGSKGNCAACHLDAERGTYEDAAMRLPQ